jgi:hypothetical protein
MEVIAIAIFHCHLKIIGRTSGRSSVGAAAYRTGERLKNEYDGVTHDFTNKRGIVYTEIMLPANAPTEYQNRETLWNAVEKSEKAKNAQTAREIEIGIPKELDKTDQIELVRGYVQHNFVDCGMCADIAIHDKKDGNPHAHIMLTMRSIGEGGEWQAKSKKVYDLDENGNKQYDPVKHQYKCRKETINDWDMKENVDRWRMNWMINCNNMFLDKEINQWIDYRSYKEQGKEQIPTIHLGSIEHQLEKSGIKSERARYNDEAREINREYEAANRQVSKELKVLKQDIKEFETEKKQQQQSANAAARQITNQLNALKVQYIDLEYEKILKEAARQKANKEIQNIRWQINDLTDRQRILAGHEKNIYDLQEKREGLSIFSRKARKETDENITEARKIKQEAIYDLYSAYNIKFGQIDSYLEKLNEKLKIRLSKPTESSYQIETQQKNIKNEYDKIMRDTEEHPHKNKIIEILNGTKFTNKSKDIDTFFAALQNTKTIFSTYTPRQKTPQQDTLTQKVRTRSHELER